MRTLSPLTCYGLRSLPSRDFPNNGTFQPEGRSYESQTLHSCCKFVTISELVPPRTNALFQFQLLELDGASKRPFKLNLFSQLHSLIPSAWRIMSARPFLLFMVILPPSIKLAAMPLGLPSSKVHWMHSGQVKDTSAAPC